jgi:sec-independent protein translocase protein TatA
MGNIGAWEIALIVLVILLVFGPKRLPQMGRSLGRGMREFKETVTDQTRELKDATIDAPKEFKEALNPLAPSEKDEEPAKAPAPEATPAPVAAPAPVATPAEPVPAAVATPAEEKAEPEGDKPS